MDRYDVEPGDGLHEDQHGLRQLLCGALLRTLSRRGRSSVRARLRSDIAAAAPPAAFAWKRPRMIFVNSMSDLFQKEIPKAYIEAVFDTMEKANWHAYQVLTKRSSLLQKFLNDRYRGRKAPPHMWFGVSVENKPATSRIAHLQESRSRCPPSVDRECTSSIPVKNHNRHFTIVLRISSAHIQLIQKRFSPILVI